MVIYPNIKDNRRYLVEYGNVPLLTSSAFILFSFVCPLPKSLAKFVGVRPGVNPGVMPEVFVTFSKRVMNLGVRGERNMPGESLPRCMN